MTDASSRAVEDFRRRYRRFLERCGAEGLDIVTHIGHDEFQISVVGSPDLRFVCRNRQGDILDRSETDQMSLLEAWIARVKAQS